MMRHSEKGQALPLAIAALAIGTMMITPFIAHAASSLIGSRTYAEAIAQRSAGDAGVEHAIWSLAKGGLAEELPDPGDELTYELGEALNGITPTITITANITGGGGGAGMIDDTITDSLIFDTTLGNYPDIINVSSGIYAIAYQGTSNRGYLKTVAITSSGDIGSSTIDSLIFDSSACSYPDIIRVSGNTYAIAYQGTSNRGYLKTVSITSSGDIGSSVIDTLIFDSSAGREPTIINVSGTTYAIAYRGSGNKGYLKTVSITSSGDIGNSVIDTLTFDNNAGYYPDIINISGSMFAIAYRGNGSRGMLATVSIASNGDIASSITDSLIFDSSACVFPDIIYISGNIYAIAYQGSGNDGFFKTVSIASNGDIAAGTTDSLEFDTSNGGEPVIIYVSGDTYAIAYRGPSNKGYLTTVSIASNGDIGNSVIDTLIFDSSAGYYPSIIQVASGVFAIAYQGTSNRGYLKTVGIGTQADVTSAYRIVATAGESTIRAFINIVSDNVSANVTIVSWQVN